MATASSTLQDRVIDLTTCDGHHTAYQPDRVIAWLRSSGGSLGERAMKCAAADMLEQRGADAER